MMCARPARHIRPRLRPVRQVRDNQADQRHRRRGEQMDNAGDADDHPCGDCEQRADRLDDVVTKKPVALSSMIQIVRLGPA